MPPKETKNKYKRAKLTGTIPKPAKTGYKGAVNYSPQSSPIIVDTIMDEASVSPPKTNNKSKKNSSGNHAKPMDIDRGGNKSKKRNNKN